MLVPLEMLGAQDGRTRWTKVTLSESPFSPLSFVAVLLFFTVVQNHVRRFNHEGQACLRNIRGSFPMTQISLLAETRFASQFCSARRSSVPSECMFSYAGRTDSDPRCRNFDAEKFGTMKEAYWDGRISAQNEAQMEIGPCFDDGNLVIE
ncbi:uncharacterized protein EV420DRAFT_1754534 [Desarmillaria tabescens]|uniref:Uncharacterized protein n=1 Tax=Armillaria tabescens TaxID=1929756 RepID=A0AA39MI73_ARMTA|nr:uncharacterized protein EV420DRAFT_1754534 [Desarmillaria tabescens]KAK0434390.1 hypothetical protein EV420DRAFT_1754534 [Desarmillaria tabescens]